MKGISLSDFEFNTPTLKTLPRFWSVIYFESGVKCLDDFESMLPNDSKFFTCVKSSPVKYQTFMGIIQTINKKEVAE